jgi:DNA repair protein RadC
MSQSSLITQASALFVCESGSSYRPANADEILQSAQHLLKSRIRGCELLGSPALVRTFLQTKLGLLEHELFAVLMLDAQNRLIEYVEMFRGTVSQTSVYPREIVKASLSFNAAAVILCHNHPSGSPDPSRADEVLTTTLKTALALVDVRVLDHLIVTSTQVVSFAERGLL